MLFCIFARVYVPPTEGLISLFFVPLFFLSCLPRYYLYCVWFVCRYLVPVTLQVVMATNRIDILDPALLRPGRIDRKIEFPHPTLTSRMDIMGIHSRKMNLLRGIDLKVIAEKMPSASGAECKVRCGLATRQKKSTDTTPVKSLLFCLVRGLGVSASLCVHHENFMACSS